MEERTFFDVMKETLGTIAPGLKNFGPEIGAELSRMGKLGAHEMAGALFNGAAYTPYGTGQYTNTPELDKGQETNSQEAKEQPEQERDQGGREM